jgi:hypothetical protein
LLLPSPEKPVLGTWNLGGRVLNVERRIYNKFAHARRVAAANAGF